MEKVPIPFTGQKVNPTDPKEVVMTILLLSAGFMVLFLTQDFGSTAKQTASETLGVGSDSQNTPDIL